MTEVSEIDFASFFERATGHPPFAYQRALAESTPEVLSVPTGCGKTAALLIPWLFDRRQHRTGPRRLVYALPMRSLVEQTASVARGIRERLEVPENELRISVLMGGVSDRDWAARPESDQIVIGTIDMLLSRALNRGYAEGRFAWPISFGLLNNDCRWIFDEVQLMGPALTTSLQLDGLRAALGTSARCESVWASATVESDLLSSVDRPAATDVLELPPEDRQGALAKRLDAEKTLSRAELAPAPEKDSARAIADLVAGEHQPGTRTIVVLNRVPRAQQVASALQRRSWQAPPPRIVPLHSRFRPPDRAANTIDALEAVPPAGTIVVATQVIEAGVDVSARLLVSDTAPFTSMIQRLGRCNRYGDDVAARAIWLDRGPIEPSKGDHHAAPYEAAELVAARSMLAELEGCSVSPGSLESIAVPERRRFHATLRRRDLLDLFDTAPDLSGSDIDVAPFIRADEERNVPVFFRDLPEQSASEVTNEKAPTRDELVDVPIGDLRKLLGGKGARAAWAFDHVNGGWIRVRASDLVPGRPVMLASADGGYDSLGWNPTSRRAVAPVQGSQAPAPELTEWTGFDDNASTSGFVTLADHLARVADEAAALVEAIGQLEGDASQSRAVTVAAALHDIGKAHAVFQEALHEIADKHGRDDLSDTQLAKSPERGSGYARRHFRHELASALAMMPLQIPYLEGIDRLATYLVAAHHGRVRASIRSATGEKPPADADGRRYALGIVDGDALGLVQTPLGVLELQPLDLAPMELGAPDSWVGRVVELRDDPGLGPFRLAYLEAVLRISDWRGSA